MLKEKIASIDIGTNTILMTIATSDGGVLTTIRDEHSIARLGEGVNKSGKLKDEAIDRSAKILENYYTICQTENVSKILPVGTSALRDSSNAADALRRFENILRCPVRLISGDEEARLSFMGTAESSKKSFVVDIGGGSTEIITGRRDNIYSRNSLQIGSVRITEKFFSSQPPDLSEIEDAKSYINEQLGLISSRIDFEEAFAVAGTATTLASISQRMHDFQFDNIHGYRLSKEQLTNITNLLGESSLEYIIDELHVNPKRADVIFAGSLILLGIMDYFCISELIISGRGLRYGVLFDYFSKQY